MERASLSDATALTFLTEWLDDSFQFTTLAPSRDALEHTHIEVHFLNSTKDLVQTHDRAIAICRAMEGLNALACCRGFGLHENARFWRQQLKFPDEDELGDTSARLHPFAPDMLTRYRISTVLRTSSEATAWAIATCCTMYPDSTAMQARRDINERLGPYLVRAPPLLELELYPHQNRLSAKTCQLLATRETHILTTRSDDERRTHWNRM